ncbi:MAG: PEP-CTERM sorting domain-containing protein, partial [Planctomycetota bacterium]
LSGSGVETTAVTAIDLGEFWTSDPNRTSATPGTPPSVVSDISDRAIGLWFFDAPGSIGFGALDAADTVTFTDGVLTSIDLSIPTTFDVGGSVWNGTFSITGDQLSYQINEVQPFGFGTSTLVADITGTVGAVGSFVIPEPSSLGLLGVSTLLLSRRRR